MRPRSSSSSRSAPARFCSPERCRRRYRMGRWRRQCRSRHCPREQIAECHDQCDHKSKSDSLVVAPVSDRRRRQLGHTERGDQQARAGNRKAHHARRQSRNLVRPRNKSRDPETPETIDAIGDEHPEYKKHAEHQRGNQATVLSCSRGEQRRLTQRIERQREESTDQGHTQWVARLHQAAQPSAPDANQWDHGAGRRRQHRAQVDDSKQCEKANGAPGAERSKPNRQLATLTGGATAAAIDSTSTPWPSENKTPQ